MLHERRLHDKDWNDTHKDRSMEDHGMRDYIFNSADETNGVRDLARDDRKLLGQICATTANIFLNFHRAGFLGTSMLRE